MHIFLFLSCSVTYNHVYIPEYIVSETSEGRNIIGYVATEYEGIIICCTCVSM